MKEYPKSSFKSEQHSKFQKYKKERLKFNFLIHFLYFLLKIAYREYCEFNVVVDFMFSTLLDYYAYTQILYKHKLKIVWHQVLCE